MFDWIRTHDGAPLPEATHFLCFLPELAADETFSGHPYLVFCREDLTPDTIGHWKISHVAAVTPPEAGILPWIRIADGVPSDGPRSGVLFSPVQGDGERRDYLRPYMLSNPEWAGMGFAEEKGYTHWVPINPPEP